ncbi:hypothetical protein J2X61_002718 [Bacillus sp. 3255]|nr:hypothetical protein [Bacillus sp. 3255]
MKRTPFFYIPNYFVQRVKRDALLYLLLLLSLAYIMYVAIGIWEIHAYILGEFYILIISHIGMRSRCVDQSSKRFEVYMTRSAAWIKQIT